MGQEGGDKFKKSLSTWFTQISNLLYVKGGVARVADSTISLD